MKKNERLCWGDVLNKKQPGDQLFDIEIVPKGETRSVIVSVYAKNRLDASNFMIRNRYYGKQIRITYANVNLLK